MALEIAGLNKLVETDEETVPAYAIHDSHQIKGFFGPYRFLSNFYEHGQVFFEGHHYRTSENAYQAAKTRDFLTREKFLRIHPGQAKKLGQQIQCRPDWAEVKTEIMCAVVFDKFARNRDLRAQLLATGLRYLEEANHWRDVCWGTVNGVGENRLGKILMNVRLFWQKQTLT